MFAKFRLRSDESFRRYIKIHETLSWFSLIRLSINIFQVWGVFSDTRRFWRVSKWRGGRSSEARSVLSRPLSKAGSDHTDTTATPANFCKSLFNAYIVASGTIASSKGLASLIIM